MGSGQGIGKWVFAYEDRLVPRVDKPESGGKIPDPRNSFCEIAASGAHKWARVSKDNITRAKWVVLLRCRYCAQFYGVQFDRVVLPSGRVEVRERPFETIKGDAAPVELHETDDDDDASKVSDDESEAAALVVGRMLSQQEGAR